MVPEGTSPDATAPWSPMTGGSPSLEHTQTGRQGRAARPGGGRRSSRSGEAQKAFVVAGPAGARCGEAQDGCPGEKIPGLPSRSPPRPDT